MIPRALLASVAYFAAALAAGFLLGTIRVLIVAPRIGELAAVLGELPIMLATCWAAARALHRRLHLQALLERILMGEMAFVLLLCAEYLLATAVFGRTTRDYLAALGSTAGVIGLFGQALFGTLPAAQWLMERHAVSSSEK